MSGDVETYEAGVEAFRAGELEAAAKHFASLVERFPRSDLADNALYQLGMVRSFQGREPEALECFRRCLAEYGDTDAAPLAAKKAAALEEELGPELEERARKLFHDGQNKASRRDYDGALRAFTECVREYPNSSLADNAYLHLATVQSLQGNFREARHTLALILEKFPGTDAASMVPVALKRLEQDEDALS